MQSPAAPVRYILGLDLGVASIGWAVLGLDADDRPDRIVKTGVRIFEAGKEGVGGTKEEPRNQKRRQARAARRSLWRRRLRADKLFRHLQGVGLLPEGDGSRPAARHALLQRLDATIMASRRAQAESLGIRIDHVLPYWLRALGLDERLEPHELGRALYHLVQRRGYKSNRVAERKPKGDEDKGKVQSGIDELSAAMQAAGARTLGEFFARLDPEQSRIRRRWTARGMFEAEFGMLWERQAGFYPEVLTEKLKKQVRGDLYFQRPLRVQSHLIGECTLEPGRRRAPMALLLAQRFRYLQRLNDLRIVAATGEEHPLDEAQRTTVRGRLEQGDAKFTELRKLLGLGRGVGFNLERGGEKNLPGNRTRAKLVAVFGRPLRRQRGPGSGPRTSLAHRASAR